MKIHVENSKKFEIDRLLINKIYNIKEKKKPKYKIIKKNVVYDKQLTKQYFKYSNFNKSNYYSNYQSFREYLSTGYDSEFLDNEIKNINSILDISRNIRQIVEKKLNHDNSPNIPKIPIINRNPAVIEGPIPPDININIVPPIKKNNNHYQKSGSIRRPSAAFQVDKESPQAKIIAELAHRNDKFAQNFQKSNKFIELCKLLKLKEEEMKYPQNQYHFRLYSMLSEEFDPFFLPVYENFVNVKYENQKMSLTNVYNKERTFISFVTSIKKQLRSHIINSQNQENKESNSETFNSNMDIIRQNIKQEINISPPEIKEKIPYINAFFFGRTDTYFKNIDNFMSMYKENISLASKRLEKDFFENLYKILTYNNTDCKKFLQYLYSNSYFFKYIYNIFSIHNKPDESFKNNIFFPIIKKHNDGEPFLDDATKVMFESKDEFNDDNNLFNIQNKEKEEEQENEEDSKKQVDEFIESLIGNEFIYKISLIKDDVNDILEKKDIKKFKKIIYSNDKYDDDCIIVLNNDNILQIYNTRENQNIFNFSFDKNINFYDLEKDLKNKLKSDKIQKNEKYIIIKRSSFNYNNSYIFKISKVLYNRFYKSISFKGKKIHKKELFSTESDSKEESSSKKQEIDINDILSPKGGENNKNQSKGIIGDKIQNSESETEKRSSTKNENNIKFDQRNPSRSISFRNTSVNKSNSGNEKSDKDDQGQKMDSSMEAKEKKNKDGEDSEEEENDDDNEINEENDGEEDENDNNDENKNDNSMKKRNKIKNEINEEDENSEKDNINEDKDKEDNKSEENDINNKKSNQKNFEEEINTDLDNFNMNLNNQPTIESKSKSSKNDE